MVIFLKYDFLDTQRENRKTLNQKINISRFKIFKLL